jgi:hypothetical protein
VDGAWIVDPLLIDANPRTALCALAIGARHIWAIRIRDGTPCTENGAEKDCNQKYLADAASLIFFLN